MTETAPNPDSAALSFASLPLAPAQLANLDQLGYRAMTAIQAAALPAALAGRDLIAQAKTGSGKTAAFALPLLQKIDQPCFAVQSLVLCPTRELAEQVSGEIRLLARAIGNIKVMTLCGGTPIRPQRMSLEHGAHVVVGTPGRVLDHLEGGSLVLGRLATLVLDEADRMLDMGFHDDIAAIASRCPPLRQTLMFSATFPEDIAELASRFLKQPETVKLASAHDASKIRQRFYEVAPETRFAAVVRLLRHYRPASSIAFCNTRQQCRELVEALQAEGIVALALHGELEQRERDQVLVRFAQRSCSVLVATDVAARGLDIAQLEAVINVDLSPDPDVHLHRIGRTGRGDAEGWAFSLVAPEQRGRAEAIATALAISLDWKALEELSDRSEALLPEMATLQILGGRRDKIRPGDVLGALIGVGLSREQVGKIAVMEAQTYAAVAREFADGVVRKLGTGTIKGRRVKLRRL
ncbi:ATP-dependent RNA helicase DbpA [Niveibacterium terrae]|uniref:ATP-dependent RNA helicase DbpA n=1 Tax=Niveibacterium terrae TaxID=3373598 RepID=UPI003A8DFAEC